MSSLSIDRWWATAGSKEPMVVNLTADLQDEIYVGGSHVLDIDIENSLWDLSEDATVSIFHENGDQISLVRTRPFGLNRSAQIGVLEKGKYIFRVDGLLAPSSTVVEKIDFHLSTSSYNGTPISRSHLPALFISDNPETVGAEELVKKYAPILHFDAGYTQRNNDNEPYALPFNIAETFGKSFFSKEERVTGDDNQSFDLSGYGNKSYTAQDTSASIYASVVKTGGEIAINYYFHYPFSNWGEFGGHNTHEGDWEGVTVFLGSSNQPDRVAFSQHVAFLGSGGGTVIDWEYLETEGDSVHVYVGLGAHASFPYPGVSEFITPSGIKDEFHKGDYLTFIPRDDQVIYLPPLGSIPSYTDNPDKFSEYQWLLYPGLWGSRGKSFLPTAGDDPPNGPAFINLDKNIRISERGNRWLNPSQWDEDFESHATTSEIAGVKHASKTTSSLIENLYDSDGFDDPVGEFAYFSCGNSIFIADKQGDKSQDRTWEIDGVPKKKSSIPAGSINGPRKEPKKIQPVTIVGGSKDDYYLIKTGDELIFDEVLDFEDDGSNYEEWYEEYYPQIKTNSLFISDNGGSDTLAIYDVSREGYALLPFKDGTDIYDYLFPSLPENGLSKGQMGLAREGTTLIIDLNRDGIAELIEGDNAYQKLAGDLAISNFFSPSGDQPGKGFIEKFVGWYSGDEILWEEDQFSGQDVLNYFTSSTNYAPNGGSDASLPGSPVDPVSPGNPVDPKAPSNPVDPTAPGNPIDKADISGTDDDDLLYGQDTDEQFTGGLGDDALTGKGGSDTYIYSTGDGNDTIRDKSNAIDADIDILQFGSGILPEDITLSYSDHHLYFELADGSRITSEWQYANKYYGLEEVHFADGTVWDRDRLTHPLTQGTNGNDNITGTADNNRLVGERSDDFLEGLEGNDTYIYNVGDGNDTIEDRGYETDVDILKFGDDILPSNIQLSRSDYHLFFNLGSGETITDKWHFYTDRYGLEEVHFVDGTVWTQQDINARLPVS